ncbi:VCBS repeat-containing protein [Actinoplanes sp. TRM 88003]|uniref:VCBS repeat-containing protein n=1 Tax=Paractinoplanes aksuensis TaxID=2939490 RepID=A0ABT1DEL1_9ACTN|nr:VCBS repeat-containing protein [Actinoplanes aksuensis]MCO8269254.1 VCBS repeat-containing protein [Actinoplanes aksuensis]
MKTGVACLATVGLVVALTPGVASAASSGTFLPVRYLNTGSTETNAVAVADVTGDGRPDILAGLGPADNTQTSALLVFAQRADRTYGAPTRLAGHGTYHDVRLATGDLDGDGRTDVAMATSKGVDVFYQRSGKLAAPVLVPGTAEDVAIADINADGRRDLIVSAGIGQVRVHHQTTTKTFPASVTLTAPVPDVTPFDQVFVADFNADGRLDVAQSYGSGAWVRLRQANGSYAAATTYRGSGSLTMAAAVGDVTGDRKADLVLSVMENQPGAAVNVFAQRAGGLNPAPTVYPAYDCPVGLAIGDLTGDGRNDLVAAHFNWLAASVYLQQSTGRLGIYTANQVDGVGNQADALAIADVTGDGKPDVLSVAYTKLAILQQR